MEITQENQYLKRCMEKFTSSDVFWDSIEEETVIESPQIPPEIPTEVKKEEQECLLF